MVAAAARVPGDSRARVAGGGSDGRVSGALVASSFQHSAEPGNRRITPGTGGCPPRPVGHSPNGCYISHAAAVSERTLEGRELELSVAPAGWRGSDGVA